MRIALTKQALILLAVAVMFVALSPASANASDEVFGFSSDTGSSESYLGVDTRDVTAERLAPLKLKEEHGVEVTMVDQDAPAGKSGIKEHDVILSVNGSQVESVEQLRRMIHEIPVGRVISVGISRNGEPLTIKTQLATRKKGYAIAWPHDGNFNVAVPPMPPMPSMPPMPEMDIPASIVVVHSSTRSGLMVENLTPQLGDYFGVKDGQGILVRSVEKGSRAAASGFHAGDVIVRVNGQKISDSGDFTHALSSRKDNTVRVTILRDRKEVNITLTVPEHGPTGAIFNNESFNLPEFNAKARAELIQAQSQMANLGPQIARETIEREMIVHTADLQRVGNEVLARTADLQRIKPEIEKATSGAREQLKQLEREINQQILQIQNANRIHRDANI